MTTTTIDCVIPCFNEEAVLPALFARLTQLRKVRAEDVQLNYIFIDDGSSDGTFKILQSFTAEENNVSVIRLSRNFGHQLAVTAGIDASDGDYTAILDADLQDPPELIIEMLNKAEDGYDVVYGKRIRRKEETLFKLLTAKLFYRFISYLCDTEIPLDTGDFRLMSRRVADAFKAMPEKRRFVRGMIPWLGFPSAPLEYVREPRVAGKTKYPLLKMVRFAIDASLSFSTKPIYLVTWLGALFTLTGVLWLSQIVYLRLFTTTVVPGYTSILAFISLFGGMQIFLTGIIGAYVARTFEESKGRPLYVVRDRIDN